MIARREVKVKVRREETREKVRDKREVEVLKAAMIAVGSSLLARARLLLSCRVRDFLGLKSHLIWIQHCNYRHCVQICLVSPESRHPV